MNGSELLVRMLAEYRTKFIFGVPGDTSIPLYEALYDAAPKIRHIMARDERSASVMADAYARFSNKPGVCECPSGAGAIFSMPGVAEAYDATRPIILITSDNALAGEGRKVITELDCKRLYEPITKWSYLIKQVEKIPETIRRAFRTANTGRPGAVHLAVPQEVLTANFAGDDSMIYGEPECMCYPAYPPAASAKVLNQLAELLINAQRVVIIAGGGAVQSKAGPEIRALAERLGSPVVTTLSGQGIMADDHPLSLGVIGDNGYHPHALRAVEEGDGLLYVGCKMGSVSTLKWTFPSFSPNRKIIQIDLDPEILANVSRNTLNIAGDAKLILEELVVLLKDHGPARTQSSWVAEINLARTQFWKAAQRQLASNDIPLKGPRVISVLNRRLTSESIIISDAGTPTPYVTRFLMLKNERSQVHIPRSYGGLGYTIPALVGAHCACPDARLIGLFGDGSLGMSAGELETLARVNVPAILIHFNNASFSWMKALQQLHSKAKYMSVDFTPGDPALVAEGFGLKAYRVQTPEELEDAMDAAFEMDRPVFLDVKTEPPHERLPPVYSWLKAAGADVGSVGE